MPFMQPFPYAELGVGVIATQALANAKYGGQGLVLTKSGMTAQPALDHVVGVLDGLARKNGVGTS
jgi:uncharacterized Ntn-hydrolase superfamily protein